MNARRPWLLLLFLIPIAIGVGRLRFDVEVLDLLPPDLKEVQGLKLYQQHFASARELIVTVRASDAEQASAAARAITERLREQPDLVASATWQPPWLEHPGQAAELIAYLWFNQPPELFGQLTNRLDPDRLGPTLASTREQLATSLSPAEIARASYDPFGLTQLPESTTSAAPAFGQGQELFSSPDGTFRIIFVKATPDLLTYRECARWLESIKQIVERAAPSPVQVGYTGRPAFVAEIAGGMERDITTSVGGTSLIIAALFWLAHRRWKPMLWLLALLAMILAGTLALGGLIFGTINVISMGFAAILLGLAVDYAVVHYQEALAHPELSIPQVRRAIAPSIFWAAVTTISAFLVLNFGGLPGLAQLGSLVGVGVALSACVMIFAFLPPLFPNRWQPRATSETPPLDLNRNLNPFLRLAFPLTALLLLLCIGVLAFGLPTMNSTADPLRPRKSSAYATLQEVKSFLNQNREPLWLIVRGQTAAEVVHRLEQVQPALSHAASNNLIAGFTLPTALWPRPDFQAANRSLAGQLASRRESLRQTAQANGFAENSLALAEKILETWQLVSAAPIPFWPTNQMSQWIFEKLTSHSPTNFFALGLITPGNEPAAARSRLSALETELPREDVWLSGWELLGSGIFSSVKSNLWKLVLPMVSLVLLSLWLAFRRWQEVLLSLAVLLLSGVCLLTVMRLAGWSWNLLNLMALPLILGTGVDYSIFMQLALRREHGDLQMAHRSVGRALLLCGATAIAGFGSLAWSTNAGMASLGQVCAVGIAGNMVISIFLLPAWWKAIQGQASSSTTGPSFLYRSAFWRLGLLFVRLLPRGISARLFSRLADVYWLLARHRREIVIRNLSPLLNGEHAAASQKARDLFHNFAVKLADLWRFEAGLPIDALLGEATGWEHLVAARAQGRGVLLLTPHLGNWEFGGPWLTRRGIPLQVITLAEPGSAFTELRRASRARWNIDTFVIGDDPFAFVEIIRRLEGGATVALLVDRPPPATRVEVKLFSRPFTASSAAAELARASGCVLLPVYIPRDGDTYSAHILPPVAYDRAVLRDRDARAQLTQQIIRAFEPAIQRHLDQRYHFVPIWPP